VFVYCKENKEQTKRITRLEEELEEERKKRSGEVRTKMKRKNGAYAATTEMLSFHSYSFFESNSEHISASLILSGPSRKKIASLPVEMSNG
jgi:hypothetical protein